MQILSILPYIDINMQNMQNYMQNMQNMQTRFQYAEYAPPTLLMKFEFDSEPESALVGSTKERWGLPLLSVPISEELKLD